MGSEESWNRLKDCEPPENHLPCANGCGFFGSAATLNLCSKCYRDLRTKQDQSASSKATVEKSLTTTTPMATSKMTEIPSSSQDPIFSSSSTYSPTCGPSSAVPVAGIPTPDSGMKNRCSSCRKPVGLMGFKCRCGRIFCGSHRYPEMHCCSFDFKAAGRDAIAKANPLVKADKIERI